MNNTDAYHHGRLRSELLRLGLEYLETQGADKLSLRLLSERAGVSKTAPYRHFKDREAFLGALADEGFRILYEGLEAHTGPDSGGVPAMGRAYMAFAVAHPALYRLMNSPIVCRMPDGQMIWARRALRLLGATLARGSSTGTDVNEAGQGLDLHATTAAWAYIHGLALIRIDGLFPDDLPVPDWDRLASVIPKLES